MKRSVPILALCLLSTLSFNSCDLLSGLFSKDKLTPYAQTLDFAAAAQSAGDAQYAFFDLSVGKASLTITGLPAGKDVYFILTNSGEDSVTSPSVRSSASVAEADLLERDSLTARAASDSSPAFPLSGSPAITASNRALLESLRATPAARSARARATAEATPVTPDPENYTVGTSIRTFYDTADLVVPDRPIEVTLRAITGVVATTPENGPRALRIWVANDCWIGSMSTKTNKVTTDMVNMVRDAFLKTGTTDNDIYDWVTAVLGAEWGPIPAIYSSRFIPETGFIDIFIVDLDNDNSTNGGTVGYFHGRNAYTQTYVNQQFPGSKSNECVAFALDAVMLATPDYSTWDATDYWPKVLVSTLAHEFQHMVAFYQVINNVGAPRDTWLDEALSMAIEDLVADKMGVDGPRGVDSDIYSAGPTSITGNGRLNLFNYYSDYTLFGSFSDSMNYVNYGVSYAFGAWLLRSFDGPVILKEIYQSGFGDQQAVVASIIRATGNDYDFADILRLWGIATLLSDQPQDAGRLRYNNTGSNGFAWDNDTDGTTDYHVGSINLFNYQQRSINRENGLYGPWVHQTGSRLGYSGRLPAASNTIVLAASGFIGTALARTVTIPANTVHLSILVK